MLLCTGYPLLCNQDENACYETVPLDCIGIRRAATAFYKHHSPAHNAETCRKVARGQRRPRLQSSLCGSLERLIAPLIFPDNEVSKHALPAQRAAAGKAIECCICAYTLVQLEAAIGAAPYFACGPRAERGRHPYHIHRLKLWQIVATCSICRGEPGLWTLSVVGVCGHARTRQDTPGHAMRFCARCSQFHHCGGRY